MWVDMAALGVDVLLSAPQKGWSGTPGVGYVMLSAAGRAAVEAGTATSFAVDLGTWLKISDAYRDGRAAYHATMPTDSILHNLGQMAETAGQLDQLREAQVSLGSRVRDLLASRGLPSVAASGFAAPSVVVVHADDPGLRSGARFAEQGVQVAAGVPLHCGEPETFSTFRVGLFGLDKLGDVDGTVARLAAALDRMGV
jgi:aspartate aminotransferase-like enzyme